MKNKILFMEDEATIREVLKEYMIMSNYEVVECEKGEEAISLLSENSFDLAVLDIMVPGIDGFGVLEYIHQNHIPIATIMLTALEDEKSQLKAFNLYADDYVVKPVSPILLLKRMSAILRRTSSREDIKEKKSGLILDTESYTAYYDEEKLPLTISEFLLLKTLHDAPNRVFNREQLILNIYNEDYIGNDRIIDAHIKNLRKKLPVNNIKTIIGVGYQYQKGE